ncbi:hypothetical protein VM1G_02558 [Cytospora mali]|uniref:Uncharacterized protein n=1 Tax=Cytospora mali TaxID=578113 RepID=A0A194VP53_CYTMA|nr:hypothetical protein VM1G_02558 [Valsa mali]
MTQPYRGPLVYRATETYDDHETQSEASGDTDKTNAFRPDYVETRLAVEKMIMEYDQRTFSINQLDLTNAWLGRSSSYHPSIRILFKHEEGNQAIKILDPEPLSLEAPFKEGVTDALGNKVELLGVPQQSDNLQCTFLVKSMECVLIYNAGSDDVFLRNNGRLALLARPISRTGAGLVSVMPTEIAVLAAALWEFTSGDNRVEVEVLPRQYSFRIEHSSTATIIGSKRPSSEEETLQQKKGRGIHGPLLSNVTSATLPGPHRKFSGQAPSVVVRNEQESVTAAFQLEPWQRLCIMDIC